MESWPSAVEVVGVEVGFDVGILGVAADVFGEFESCLRLGW